MTPSILLLTPLSSRAGYPLGGGPGGEVISRRNPKEPPMSTSLPPDYFERVYREADDPWRFASSPYEAAKYAATLAAVPRARYRNAFEIGCSIGVLTERLAGR